MSKIFFVRQDGVPIDFVNKLISIFKGNTVDLDIEFRIFNSDDIKYDMTGCISLDRYVFDKHRVDVSRLFSFMGDQKVALRMVTTGEPLETQFSRIPKGDYKLVDDDSATGYGMTMNFVKNELAKYGVNITSTDTLVRTLLNEGEVMYDIIDAIDFFAGSDGGGLVVEIDGKLTRVPYIKPYINLTNRAMILPELTDYVSKEIIDLNINYKFECNHMKSVKFKDDMLFFKNAIIVNSNEVLN